MSERAASTRVLCVIRWPVGGIRTWCRYVYSHSAFNDIPLTIAAPGAEFTSLLADDLVECDVDIVTLPDITSHFARAVRALVRSADWSLLHSHGFTAAVATAIGAAGSRLPHLVTQHDVILSDQYRGTKGLLQRQCVSASLRSADVVHSVSEAAGRNLRQTFKWLERHPEKLKVISNGIESSRFADSAAQDLRLALGLEERDFLIGFFGRFMHQKGFRYLVDAIRILKESGSNDVNPVVIATSGGGFFDREERDLAAMGLTDSFRFIPFTPNLASVLKSVDVVAMPSLWEACGLLAMEALAAGVPLICSDCDSLAEIARGTPAVVVPKANAERLAAALRTEATNPTKHLAARYAAEAVARFDVSNAAASLADLYQSMISAHRNQGARSPDRPLA